MEMGPYYAFREDDFEEEKLLTYVSMIRNNAEFMKAFNEEADMLQKKYRISLRDTNGYLVILPSDILMNELQLKMQYTGRDLSQKFAQSAVDILKSHGAEAWVNEIGFISIGNP